MTAFAPPSPLNTPVLLAAFKRFDTTQRVMGAIRKARPPRLYFACDGPRNEEEKLKTDKVRTLVELVDWPCELRLLFREENKGSKHGMIENINWFFEHEAEGIILEDDIEPAQSFFWFAQELLEKYRDDERVWAIIGNNLATGGERRDPQGYWFMGHGYGAYWGWAGWRRSWQRFDVAMKDWPADRDQGRFEKFFLSKGERTEAMQIMEYTWNGTIPGAWDYQFDHAKMRAGALNIIPNVNLCRNMGFGTEATHSVNLGDPRNQDHLHQADWPLVHPTEIRIDPERDLAYFNAFVRTPNFQRLKNAVKGVLPGALEKKVTPIASKIQKKLGLK